MISLIRYPGSKSKLAKTIIGMFPASMKHELWAVSDPMEYREPFFGSGAVGFIVLSRLGCRSKIWLNDKDPGMVALWRCVRECPDELFKRCEQFVPSAEWFYKFKEEDGNLDVDFKIAGFRKLALHRMSFSGLGAKAGGPIGGKNQNNELYDVACRWNPSHIKHNITQSHKILSKFDNLKITCLDFEEVIAGGHPRCFIYLDPPYYEKGPELYKFSMDDADHVRLAHALRETESKWILSYDEHPRIRELFAGFTFQKLKVTYTMAEAREDFRPKNHEVVIYPSAEEVE